MYAFSLRQRLGSYLTCCGGTRTCVREAEVVDDISKYLITRLSFAMRGVIITFVLISLSVRGKQKHNTFPLEPRLEPNPSPAQSDLLRDKMIGTVFS